MYIPDHAHYRLNMLIQVISATEKAYIYHYAGYIFIGRGLVEYIHMTAINVTHYACWFSFPFPACH